MLPVTAAKVFKYQDLLVRQMSYESLYPDFEINLSALALPIEIQ